MLCFEVIWNTGSVVKLNVHQCALGLTVDGEPTYKNTILLASGILLVEPFQGVTCRRVSHGKLEGRRGPVSITQLAQVWLRKMCQKICVGIRPLIRQRRRPGGNYLHISDHCFPTDGAAFGRRPRGRPRKELDGTASKKGFIFECPSRMARKHELHPSHIRSDEPPLLCRHQFAPGTQSCEACLETNFATDPDHTLEEGCRFVDDGLEVSRRMKKQLGEQAEAGPCRDVAIPAVGEADVRPITDGNFELDANI